MSKAFSKNTFLALLLVLIFTMNVGGVFSSEMMMKDGMMTPCPFMGMTAICNMTPLEHLAGWQNMFTATFSEFSTVALLLLLALAVLWYVTASLFVPKRREVFLPRYRYRERVFDPLRLAFARGILHSKAY